MRAFGRAARLIWLTIATFVVCFPLYYTIVGAFEPNSRILSGLPGLVPARVTLQNFRDVAATIPLGGQLLNSTLVTVCQTTASVLVAVAAAYALVFCRLRRPGLILAIFLATLMIPQETTNLANYLTISSWGLRDTLVAVFLPFIASALEIFLLRQAFLSFPIELRDAAALDGAGHLRFIGAVLLPVTRSAVVTATLIAAIGAWNGYFWPLLVTDTPPHQTLQIGLTQLNDQVAGDLGMVLAGATVATVPVLLLVIAGQRFLVSGLISGSVK
jgi:sn-glycerol 3-phosphate transport system permease protein